MKGRIEINTSLCKGCGYCIAVCPKSVLRMGDVFNAGGYFTAEAVRLVDCNGCAQCALMCPEIAISVWRKAGGPVPV